MRSEVMIVGVYHLGETLDLTKVEPKSLKELKLESKEVVQALSKFNPTKLAVEVVREEQTELSENYQDYQLDDLNQKKNEIELIGFPLAKKWGFVKSLVLIGWKMKMNIQN